MKLVTAPEMAALDKRTIEELKVPAIILMENAGLGVVHKLYKHFPKVGRMSVGVLVGRGNNGGDGLVVARHLHQRGVEVRAYLLARKEELRGEAKANLEAYLGIGGHLTEVPEVEALLKLFPEIARHDILVDGLLGTGLRSEVTGLYRTAIDRVNLTGKPVVAIDIPSGVDASTGRILGSAIKAFLTVTFALPKVGLVIHPGASFVGRLEVVDIGIPPFVIEEAGIRTHLIDEAQIRGYFRPRPEDSHKGDYGRLLILAGSPGMTGAAYMASQGALRVGAGLITLGIPEGLNPIMEVKLTEVMTRPLEETPEGHLSPSAAKEIEELWDRMDVVILGPGILPNPDTLKLMSYVIENSPRPLVVDAGGLDAIAADSKLLKRARSPLIITPHPGEMARILKASIDEVQGDRLGVARRHAQESGATVILKGSRTVVATPQGDIFVNPTGNPGMASGGMGDVLTGMVGGLLAQGFSQEAAACAAVYLHGKSGDRAAEKRGQMALAATDLLEELPGILKGFEAR